MLALAVLALVVLGGVIGYYCGRPTPLPEMRDPHRLVVKDLDPPDNEPWMVTHASAVRVPVAALVAIARPDDLQQARKSDRPSRLAELVHVAGIRQPVDVRFDRLGRVVLADGHNRVVMAEISGRATLPATFSTVARIPSHATPAETFFSLCLEVAVCLRCEAAARSEPAGRSSD